MNMVESFAHYFSFSLASTNEQQRDVFRVRYNVYCEEFGYEPIDRFPDRMESDEFDDRSIHFLISHKASGVPAGCVRVVPGNADKPDQLLPLETFCRESLDDSFYDMIVKRRDEVCEVSRLAVDARFRRRHGEDQSRFGHTQEITFSPEEQRLLPFIAISAFLGAAAILESRNRPNVFAMMEPFLPGRLALIGIYFQRAGQDMDYHGTRAPYFVTLQSVLENMKAELKELYDLIRVQIP